MEMQHRLHVNAARPTALAIKTELDLVQFGRGWREPEQEPEHVGRSRLQDGNQSFTLILSRRTKCHVSLFSSSLCHPAAPTWFIVPPPPPPPPQTPDKWRQPPSPSQLLEVTDFKAEDMNNQTVIFSFSSSCYWPDFMIFLLPPSSFLFSTNSLPLSSRLNISPPLILCRSPICTRSSSRFRIKETKLTQRTTTDLQQGSRNNGNLANFSVIVNIFSLFFVLLKENKGCCRFLSIL